MSLLVRNGWYYYYKRVPEYIKEYDTRTFVRISLKTKDKLEARKKAVIYEEQYNKFWQSLIQKGEIAEVSDYKQAISIAKAYGFAYKDATDISQKEPFEEIVKRFYIAKGHEKSENVVDAVLGLTDIPQIPLKDCEEKFWQLCADRFANKSDHQIKKYQNPRNRALKDFIKVIGNIGLGEIERSHILKFHQYLMDEIKKGQNADTANKKMRHVKDILRTVANANEIPFDEDILFAKTRFKLIHKSRPPFESDYVQKILLPQVKSLNKDARLLIYAMADTGARESELVGLTKDDIFLNKDIPYIWIRPKDKRGLKTLHSERQIPLVGVSLYALQQLPEGFTRYKEADAISSLINRYFTKHDLRPTEDHSLYSLRHTFKDRLRDVQAPEEIIDQLMGHRTAKPRYGRGHLLKTAHEWMQKIAFDVPH